MQRCSSPHKARRSWTPPSVAPTTLHDSTSFEQGAGAREYVPSPSVSPVRGKFSPIAVHMHSKAPYSTYSSQPSYSSSSSGVCGTHGVTDCLLCSLGEGRSSSTVGIGGYSSYQHSAGHSQFSQYSYHKRLPNTFPVINAAGMAKGQSVLSSSTSSLPLHLAHTGSGGLTGGHGSGSGFGAPSEHLSSLRRHSVHTDYGDDDDGVDEAPYESAQSSISFQRRTAEDTTVKKKVTMADDGVSSRSTKPARNHAHSAHGKLQLNSVDNGVAGAIKAASKYVSRNDEGHFLEDSGESDDINVYSNITYDDTDDALERSDDSFGAAHRAGAGKAAPKDAPRGTLPKIKSAHAGEAKKKRRAGKPHPSSAGALKAKPSPYGAPAKKINGYVGGNLKINTVGMY